MILGASTCRAARGLLDWTQTELAAAAEVGLGMLRNFEVGRCFPGETNLFALQHALEAAGVEFLPDGGVRLHPDRITFKPDYVVDRYKFRLIAQRAGRDIIVDVPRETVEDAAELRGAATVQRVASFEKCRALFESCAKDVLRGQAPEVRRVSIDSLTFKQWRKRHLAQGTSKL
jgi:transcriptional regulator with XRE-family HTH domain